MGVQPAIKAEGLVRYFDKITAVDNISFEVQPGEVFGLLGHNGAGKTTTVRLLNGVLNYSAGKVEVLGYDPVSEGSQLRRKTGILTESPSLDERLTARENLSIYATLYDVPQNEVTERVEKLLVQFELANRANEKVGGYSKGMKQRMALSRALIHEPELIFLDEPTAGLDPVATRRVHRLIEQFSDEGKTILLCTHNLVEAQKLCNRVAVLEHGKILAMGTPAELGRRFSHRQKLELEVSPETMAAAANILNSMEMISEITANKHLLTFSGADYDSIPDVIALLVAEGVRIHRVTPQDATLEDVYFALHGDGEGTPEVSA